MSRKLLATMSTLGVLGVFGAVGAGSALATPEGPSDAGTVVFTGIANVSPSIPPATDPGGVGKTGSFGFTGNCNATASSWVSLGVPSSETGTCTTIAATGTYLNAVCGTGTATGTATVNLTQPPGGDGTEGPITVHFTIVFAAGAGTLVIDSGTWDDDPTVAGSGTVVLQNLPGESCAGPGPVTGFSITGSASVTASGGPDGPVS